VIWAFSELFNKGLVYEGNRLIPYSWSLETPLSNFETRLDNSYRMRQDPSVTVAFTLDSDLFPNTQILVWTTTPWTLPSNLALAVGPEVDYVLLEKDGKQYIIGQAAFERYQNELVGATTIRSFKGAELENIAYKPLMPYFAGTPSAFHIFLGEFVSVEDGTGIVHMAPAFGEEDQQLCAKHGIEPLCPVDSQGKFTADVPDYQGLQVFEANRPIIQRLKEEKVLIRQETIMHNYPHCWRTGTPLIYKVQKSWYVKVTEFNQRMVELNQRINWIPEHIRDGLFGNWLEGAKDWSISRNRFWGTPIPIWKSDSLAYPRIDVYGSLEEIERDFGVKLNDLHRPFVDELTRPNPDDPTGKSTMRRIEDVFDCWFESGSMSFAQMHYPFENKEYFHKNFPADFIVEYVAQTRGWFYTMLVLSTALFDEPPFLNAICHGVILDEDGEKISKSKRNYPDPNEVFDKYGSDTLRWFFMSSPLMKGGDLQIDREGQGISEAARQMQIPLWNAYAFFCIYANADKIQAKFNPNSNNLLDRYILSKTAALVKVVTEALDVYDLPRACEHFERYIDILNNWYIRRSRERFWRSGADEDKIAAYDTLYTVLTTLAKLSAPFLPFVSEEIYKGLSGETSVHLADWPSADSLPLNEALVEEMDMVIDICSSALALRKKALIRVRQPLPKLTVFVSNASAIKAYDDIIAQELNVKEVYFTDEISGIGRREIALNFKTLGKVLGKDMKNVQTAVKGTDWSIDENKNLMAGGHVIAPEYFEYKLIPNEGLTGKSLEYHNGMVILDTEISEELYQEGLMRDVIRIIQNARKEANLNMNDQIEISFIADEKLKQVIEKFAEYICSQTLGKRITSQAITSAVYQSEEEIDGMKLELGIVVSAG